MATLSSGCKLLNDRYTLERVIRSEDHREIWVASNPNDVSVLAKVWPYQSERPTDLIRALWDYELRLIYRACSSPGAEEGLLLIRDARVDHASKCFVMISEGPGYSILGDLLDTRKTIPWLSPKTLRERSGRQAVWRGLKRVAVALRALHQQRIIHRAVSAESIFLDSTEGPESWRLGAFDWGVRVGWGLPSHGPQLPPWSTPPEVANGSSGYTFDTDWYAFGTLCARCFLSIEGLGSFSAAELGIRVLRELKDSSNALSSAERNLIGRLIAPVAEGRLTYGESIVRELRQLIDHLGTGDAVRRGSGPLRLVVNPANAELVDELRELGFSPDPSDSSKAYNPNDLSHVVAFKEFLRREANGGDLYSAPGNSRCLLQGDRLVLRLAPWDDHGEKSWRLAFVPGTTELRLAETAVRPTPLTDVPIDVVTLSEARRAVGQQPSRNWETVIPREDDAPSLGRDQITLHAFLRCTNQIELLMRDAEIFAYRVLSRPDTAGMEHLVIAQAERESSRPAFLEVEISLTEFLQREMESGKRDSDKVMLTPTAALRPWNVRATEAWQIEAIDVTSGYIKLARPSDTSFGRSPAPETGYVRTKGHFSAITLIERRKRAIDRLPDHSYLLRALAQPGMVYMDTGPTKLPFPLSPEVVDASKEAIISDVLRVRPLYALQGPPGTGKTTLVSHLLREILEEDPVAQILVTSQGHGAVDVLRRKVLDEAFSGVPPAQMPLAVRLGTRESADVTVDGGLNETVRELLTNVQAQVSADSDLTRAWRALVHEMLSAEDGVDAKSRRCLSDFRELVKRSASITYCTTSAQDLEALADGQQSFDWAVVEEAGKCHGFDLALPLQAGHRWLLLGDHKQLPPYRYKDFRDAISDLDNCAAAILGLPSRDLVDLDWWRDWRDRGASEKQEFQAYCQRWLRTFAQLYEQQKLAADGATRQTLLESIGASAGLLSKQYRMHPDIGTLISETFYDRTVTNATLDDAGMPLDAVLHGLSSPGYVSKKAICWLDTPDCMIDARAEEIGPSQGRPRFTNPTEVNAVVEFLSNLKPQSRTDEPLEVAILAPYTQQVLLLNERLKEYTLPPGFRFRRALSVNTSGIPSQRPAHTVDSFQGNEADIVLVSLVRNNSKLAQDPTALGFLDQADRVNVLLSRAQRLLVMVGSFSFFERQVRLVPIDNPNAYIWHWKKVLTFVEQLVVSDRASRVSLTIDRST